MVSMTGMPQELANCVNSSTGLGILHAATGNDRRALGSFQCGDGVLKFARIRHLLANAVNFGFKK
jgi:hypothetical protein